MMRTTKAVMSSIPALFILAGMVGYQMLLGVGSMPHHMTFTLMMIFGLAGFIFISALFDKLHPEEEDLSEENK